MSKIIDFYTNQISNNDGVFLNDILNWSNDRLENDHSFIQWIFPLRKASNFNPDAPLLTDEDVAFFKANFQNKTDVFYNFMNMTDRFLEFMGITGIWFFDAFGGFELNENFEKQKYTWLEFNHNALRITRMLKCLSILGLAFYAVELLNFMKSVATEKGIEYGGNRLAYWEDALKGDESVL